MLTSSKLYQNYLRLLQMSPILLALRANLAGEFWLWLLLLDLLAILSVNLEFCYSMVFLIKFSW